MGRSLCNTKDEVEPEFIDRLKALWTHRLDAARAAPSLSDFTEELANFGWWFASGKFDDDWALEQLRAGSDLVKKAEPDHLVAEKLAEIAPRKPLEVVQCLVSVVEGDREGCGIFGWIQEARTILETAIRSESLEAQETATNLVHRLGARGYLEFWDLLR